MKDRDIPYKPTYNEAPEGRDIPITCFCLCPFWVPEGLGLAFRAGAWGLGFMIYRCSVIGRALGLNRA